ncbi:hypothetical protein GCM10022206_34370 [Streptomyces chiangmaiensis]
MIHGAVLVLHPGRPPPRSSDSPGRTRTKINYSGALLGPWLRWIMCEAAHTARRGGRRLVRPTEGLPHRDRDGHPVPAMVIAQ